MKAGGYMPFGSIVFRCEKVSNAIAAQYLQVTNWVESKMSPTASNNFTDVDLCNVEPCDTVSTGYTETDISNF